MLCTIYIIKVMGKIYKDKIRIAHYHVDRTNQLSIPMIPRLAIATSVFQTTDENIGMEEIHKIGIGWVILQYDIKINQLPKFNQVITVETNPTIQNEYFAIRKFRFLDEDENELITIDSLWTMMDMTKRKIIKIDDRFAAPLESQKVEKVEKLQSPSPFEDDVDFSSRTHQANYYEIDSNQHVNNAVYFDWFLMSVDVDFLKTHEITRMIVKFQREVEPGSKVNTETQKIDENQLLHRITIDSEIKATAQTWWKEV